MHSDGNGLFYVIHLDDVSTTSHDNIQAKVELASHGKLIWDENPAELGNRGFATSTGEPVLFEIDLSTKELTSAYNYSSFVELCFGLHAIAYSGVNNHVYAECTGGGGIIELDVSNNDIVFVHQHMDATGALYETPQGDMVVASNKGANVVHVFLPGPSGDRSSIEYDIPMPGNPSTVSFYTRPSDGSTILCAPLTENLNQNQRREDGTIACDSFNGCTGAVTADDVQYGVCLHDDANAETSPLLFRVTNETSTDDLPAACVRCEDRTNFNIEEGSGILTCVCTPDCGLCDSEPEFSDDESGYMCINLNEYIASSSSSTPIEPTLIANAGGMKQGEPFGGSPECTFGGTYRTHKRGTKYDASIATIPTDSIVVINMDTMEKVCSVDLPASPSRVLYAPLKPVALEDSGATNGQGSGGAVSFSMQAMPVVMMMASLPILALIL
jgi:hypothetical protein